MILRADPLVVDVLAVQVGGVGLAAAPTPGLELVDKLTDGEPISHRVDGDTLHQDVPEDVCWELISLHVSLPAG